MSTSGSQLESAVVYAAGAAQGLVLVTFPAASSIFTDPSEYDLSKSQYGAMFLPQVVTAITASLLGARLGERLGIKRVYLAGLLAGLVSMVLLVISQFFTHNTSLAYTLLLLATASLGVGFGLTVPALNTLTAAFHPGRVDSSILVLNALLGLGTVLAPVLVAIFLGLGFWWGLPVTAAILLTVLLAVSLGLPLRAQTSQPANEAPARGGIPSRFWVYGAFAVLYGICETINGNWAQTDMTSELGASTTTAALALTAFWAMVTIGRVVFAAIQHRFPSRLTYHLLPFLLCGALFLISALPQGAPHLGVVAFGLAGLGCSALLPLTISFGQKELVAMSAAAAGGVIAFYQVGYGLAAFGVGPLLNAGVSLSNLYALAAGVAAAMGALSFVVAHRQESPASIHPRPQFDYVIPSHQEGAHGKDAA